ncbi:hypothetical protein WN51_13486 [Melipona quadrifasciata]|uniref:Uncharacterized protein n=1 Tax=Melipona quadrifasciata TaxID=166423 RepID=A0A0M9A0K7_9HYME|nr:hypothetical protein WN51_13486 [Melipona quadrifasciata]
MFIKFEKTTLLMEEIFERHLSPLRGFLLTKPPRWPMFCLINSLCLLRSSSPTLSTILLERIRFVTLK